MVECAEIVARRDDCVTVGSLAWSGRVGRTTGGATVAGATRESMRAISAIGSKFFTRVPRCQCRS
jgi:hypothetical protein